MNKCIDVLEARIFNVEEAETRIWKRGNMKKDLTVLGLS